MAILTIEFDSVEEITTFYDILCVAEENGHGVCETGVYQRLIQITEAYFEELDAQLENEDSDEYHRYIDEYVNSDVEF